MPAEKELILKEACSPTARSLVSGVGTAYTFSTRPECLGGSNQDAAAVFRVSRNQVVLAVADGLGGMPNGAQASQLALHQLGQALNKPSTSKRLRGAIIDGIEAANQAILGGGNLGGTTLAIVSITREGLRPFHVGDSAIYQISSTGKLKWQSISHSPVGYAVTAGVLDDNDALFHQERHLISNMVGSEDMHIDVGPELPFKQRDTILVCSDGLSDNLHLDEICSLAPRGRPTNALTKLGELALSRMTEPRPDHPSKPDDCTFILFRKKSAKRKPPPRKPNSR